VKGLANFSPNINGALSSLFSLKSDVSDDSDVFYIEISFFFISR